MHSALARYVRGIATVNTKVGSVFKYGLLVLIGILMIEAIARFGLNKPQIWTLELGEFVLGGYYMMAGGYALLKGAHVRMDILYNRWSAKRRAVSDVATFSFLAVFLVVLILGGVDSSLYAIEMGQYTQTPWGPILAPIKIIATIGIALLFLQCIADFIQDVLILRGRPIS
jgi:TRAP-type mannitol/chloroaromatic compound transport system permease small subunit